MGRHKGRPLTAEALAELAPLSRLLERDETFSRITLSPAGQRRFRLEVLRRWRNLDALLLPSQRRWLSWSAPRTFRTRSLVRGWPARSFSPTIRGVMRGAGATWRFAATEQNRQRTDIVSRRISIWGRSFGDRRPPRSSRGESCRSRSRRAEVKRFSLPDPANTTNSA